MDQPSTSGVKRASTSKNRAVPSTKKKYLTRPQNKDHADIIEEWLNESSESDCDDIDPNFVPMESDHHSSSEQQGSDREETTSEEPETESHGDNISRPFCALRFPRNHKYFFSF